MMPFPISPETFWEHFSINFRREWKKDIEQFEKNYQKSKEYTKIIIPILEALGDKLECKSVEKEYWPKYDVTFFSEEADEWQEWALEVAIEHENESWPKWQSECRKLMLGIAGLKVLITYRKETKEDLEGHLKEFQKVFKGRKYHQTNENWLFIFGPDAEVWDRYDFVAYKFDGTEHTEITAGKKTFHD